MYMKTFRIVEVQWNLQSTNFLLGAALNKFAELMKVWKPERDGVLEMHSGDNTPIWGGTEFMWLYCDTVLSYDENGLTGDPIMVRAINKLLSKNA